MLEKKNKENFFLEKERMKKRMKKKGKEASNGVPPRRPPETGRTIEFFLKEMSREIATKLRPDQILSPRQKEKEKEKKRRKKKDRKKRKKKKRKEIT